LAQLFEVSDDIKAIAQAGIDDLIDQLGKDCRLIYPSKMDDCINCVLVQDPIGKNQQIVGGMVAQCNFQTECFAHFVMGPAK